MSLGIGGAETHVVGLAKQLSARGWEVHVASSGGQLVNDLTAAGINHVYAPLSSRSPVAMWRAYWQLDDFIVSHHIGLVHSHARIPAWISSFICRKRGIPLAMTYHGTFASGPFWRAFTRPGDMTIAVSDDIKEYIVRSFGFDPDSIIVIPNGIDLETFTAADPLERKRSRSLFSVSESRTPVILYMSRLEGDLVPVAEAVIEATDLLRQYYPNLTLLIAGDGEGLGTIKQICEALNDKAGYPAARCLGFVKETPPLYACADIVLGMSRVALEAMATETPVIIVGPGGIFGPVRPELADTLEERNYTSRNAPVPASPAQLAQEVRRVLSDETLRVSLGRFGRQQVEARHSMDSMAEETEKVYFSLLSRRDC